MAALGGLSLGLMFSIAYLTETTGTRVEKAGYRAATAQARAGPCTAVPGRRADGEAAGGRGRAGVPLPPAPGPLSQRGSKYVTRSGRARNGLAHSDDAPVMGWASVTTT
jgi:hypothetical protein